MKKVELDSRENVNLLVRTFYDKVQKDELIGPIFNRQIEDWEEHYERLTDFWETNLLFIRRYKGNPVVAHNKVDKANDHSTTQVHFGRWLQLWFETLNDLFTGDNAELAKRRARNMSTHMFMKMYAERERIEKGRNKSDLPII